MTRSSSDDQKINWRNETLEQTRDRIRREWGDYLLTILIINPVNLRLARWIAPRKITPNQLTIISFAMTVLSAACFASLSRPFQVLGGLLLLAGYFIDCLDGDLARLKGLKSPLGAMLDPILDRFGEIAIITGISVNGFRTTNEPKWLLLGMVLVGLNQIYFYLVDAMVWKLPDPGSHAQHKEYLNVKGTRVRFGLIEPFVWGQAILAFMGSAFWGVVIFNIMFFLGVIKVLHNLLKRAKRLEPAITEVDDYGTHSR